MNSLPSRGAKYLCQLYFLQRHPSRKDEPCNWTFVNPPTRGEMVFISGRDGVLIRGSTPLEGVGAEVIFDGFGYASRLPHQDIYTPFTIKDTVLGQNWIARSQVFIDTDRVAAGSTSDPHSAIIPLTKPHLYLGVPQFLSRLSRRRRTKFNTITRVKRKNHDEYAKNLKIESDAGRISQEEYYKQLEEFTAKPENLVRIKMRIRANGTEARILILDVL